MRRVAFQGELGAYSEEAIGRLWPNDAEPVPKRELGDVVAAVAAGEVELGLLPVENTLAGSVVGSYDALAEHPSLWAVAEVTIPIHHCVLGVRGATLERLERVESHPVALAQCAAFLRAHPWIVPQAAYDTAGAARAVAERADPRVAAIAGRAAAARFALEVLAAEVEDRPDNQTRFLAVGREPARLAEGVPARTTLLLTTANVPGALYRALEPLAAHGLNLSKLESRPTGEPWSYRFFVDIEHAAGDPRLEAAVEAIGAVTHSLRRVGTYGRAAAGAVPAPRDPAGSPAVPRGAPGEAAGEGSEGGEGGEGGRSVRTEPTPPPAVVVIGLGVIGGSLARVLAARGGEVMAFAASEVDRSLAVCAGIRVADSLVESVRAARSDGLVVVAVPPGALREVVEAVAPVLPAEVPIVHVTGIQSRAGLALPASLFDRVIGAHPLAGTHESGFAASRIDLFRGCTVSVEDRLPPPVRPAIERLWSAAGAARVEYRSAEEHDRQVAWVSHLPQLAATGVAAALARAGIDVRSLGPGGRDVTRLAASPFGLWREILARAPADTLAALEAVEGVLAVLRTALAAGDLERVRAVWAEAAAWRRAADQRVPPTAAPAAASRA
jgi:prephenate dehydratase